MTRTRQFWEVSVLLVLGVATLYATTVLENPWIVLVFAGVLTFVALVPNASRALIVRSIQLVRSVSWWQALWFLILIGGLIFRSRSAGEISRSPVDGLALFRIGCSALVAVVLFFRLTFRKTNWLPSLFSGLIGVFALFGVISLVSLMWSVNPPWTLYKSVEFLIDVAVLAGIVATLETVQDFRKFINWTWILRGLLVASAWVGAVLDPADGLFADPYIGSALPARLVGVMPVVPSNELSEISGILGLVALCRLWTDSNTATTKTWYRLLFVASMITMVITQTRAVFAAFLIGLTLLLVFTHRYFVLVLGGMIASGIGVVLLAFTNFAARMHEFLLRGETSQQAAGFSGRMEIWQLSIHKIAEQPWIGFGGFAGARFAVLSKSTTAWSDAMNIYIDAMLNIGILGPVLILILVALVGWQLFRTVYRSSSTPMERSLAMEMSLAYTIIVIVNMESGGIIQHPMMAFLVLLGFAEFLRRRHKALSVAYAPRLHSAVGA
jgi:O-Antigen ligase